MKLLLCIAVLAASAIAAAPAPAGTDIHVRGIIRAVHAQGCTDRCVSRAAGDPRPRLDRDDGALRSSR